MKNVDEALFFDNEVHKNNWSRDVLLNFLDTNLYKREGKAMAETLGVSLSTVKRELSKSNRIKNI